MEAAQRESNILLISYIILSLIIKDGRYLAAFLLCEIVSLSVLFDWLTPVQYYLIPAIVYCYITTLLLINNNTNKGISCAIIILFYVTAAIDDYLYREVETYFYVLYGYIFMAVHCQFIYMFINWGALRRAVGHIVNLITSVHSVNYNLQYFCYNIKNNQKS